MIRRTSVAMAVLAVALAFAPLAAVAQVEDGTASDPSTDAASMKIFDLGMCAVSIAAIETGVGVAVAVLTCGRAAAIWWSE